MLRRRQALTLDEIDQLEAEWSALDARCVNPLGTFSWVRAALQAFEDDARPWIMAVSAGDRLRALAPLRLPVFAACDGCYWQAWANCTSRPT